MGRSANTRKIRVKIEKILKPHFFFYSIRLYFSNLKTGANLRTKPSSRKNFCSQSTKPIYVIKFETPKGGREIHKRRPHSKD
jgi:hypothetical protein